MKLERLVQQLQDSLAEKLESVTLYGSAAAGDHTGKRSDYNLLAVTRSLSVQDLTSISDPIIAWNRAGNPPPLLLTVAELERSADVFPIEILDMKDARKVLYGTDVIERLVVSTTNLRHQVEHELKGNLLRLRDSYLLVAGKRSKVLDLMVDSLSTFLVLFRAVLRLHGEVPPVKKLAALQALKGHIDFDSSVFFAIEEIKEEKKSTLGAQPETLFGRYLKSIETVVRAVDEY